MSIGLKIKELRKVKNLTQVEFSNIIGIDNSQLSKIEQGKITPTINQILEISSKFNVPTDWLLSNKNKINQVIKGHNLFSNNIDSVINHNNASPVNNEDDKKIIEQLERHINILEQTIRIQEKTINTQDKLIKSMENK